MNRCPSPVELRRLLDSELSATAALDAARHVDDCPACQAALDALSDDTELRGLLPSDGLPPLPTSVNARFSDLVTRARSGRPRAPEAPESFLSPPRRDGDLGTLGPYAVEVELGRGGMGIVLRARDEALQRAVALKVLRPALADERSRARFVREAQAVARVKNDHVVGVHSVCDPPGGLPYFVMELLPGPTLAELIGRHGRLAPHQAAELVAQAADGLAAAHAAGVIHRDIKPGNVLLDDAGRARITDFGLARLEEPSGLTEEGALAGTPSYMSPEQARGGDLDGRSDIYSLGVTLYETLTGTVPFSGAAHMVLRQIAEDEPAPPRRLNDAVPRDLETVCLKAMAREPHRRYATAADFREDLRRFLNGEPVRARPLGRLGRLVRWCRREPVRASLLGALLVALAGALWQWARAESEAAEAERRREQAVASLREADAHFAEAAKAVNTFYGRVYEEGLLGRPISPEVRLSLMEDALAFYRALPESRRADAATSAGEAEAHFRHGFALSQLRRPREALDAFARALPRYEALLRSAPDDLRLLRGVAHTHFHSGRMHDALGDAAAALRSWGAARDRLAELARRDPGEEPRYYLAGCHGNLIGVHLWNDDRAAARAAADAAAPLLEKLLAESKDFYRRLDYQSDYTYVCRSLGDLAPDADAAVRWQQRGRDVAEQRGRAMNWSDSNAVRFAAMSYAHLGLALARQGKLAEALTWLERGKKMVAGATRVDPRHVPLFDGSQAICSLYLGDVQLTLGRSEDALRSWEEARALYEKLPAVRLSEKEFRENLARTHLRLGDLQRQRGDAIAARQSWAAAAAVWDALLAEYPDHPRLRRERAELASRPMGPP